MTTINLWLVAQGPRGLIAARKWRKRDLTPSMDEQRALILSALPGVELVDHLSRPTVGRKVQYVVGVWLSPNSDGNGRSGSAFYEWGVLEKI